MSGGGIVGLFFKELRESEVVDTVCKRSNAFHKRKVLGVGDTDQKDKPVRAR